MSGARAGALAGSPAYAHAGYILGKVTCTAMAEQVHGEQLGWREAFGFLIGAVFMACPLFIGVAEVVFIGYELFRLIYSGENSLELSHLVFIAVFLIPLSIIFVYFSLIFPTIPLNMAALLVRYSGSIKTYWLTIGASVCLSALASLALYTLTIADLVEGLLGSEKTVSAIPVALALAAQISVLTIASRLARQHPV